MEKVSARSTRFRRERWASPLHIPQCPVHGILNQKPGQISFPQRNSPSMGHPFLLSYLAPGRECRDSFPVLSKRSYGSCRPGLGAGCRPPALRRDCSFGPLWYIIGKQESLAGRHHLNHMLKSLLQNVNSAAGSFLAVSSIAGAGLAWNASDSFGAATGLTDRKCSSS